MPSPHMPIHAPHEDEAVQQFFTALDGLCDVLTGLLEEMEFWRIASPKERLLILRGNVIIAVAEWFREPMARVDLNTLTPDEQQAWLRTATQTREEGRKA